MCQAIRWEKLERRRSRGGTKGVCHLVNSWYFHVFPHFSDNFPHILHNPWRNWRATITSYKIRWRITPLTRIFEKSMKVVHRNYELHWIRRILFESSRQIKIASTNYKQTAVLFFSFQSVSIFLIFSTFSDIFPHIIFSTSINSFLLCFPHHISYLFSFCTTVTTFAEAGCERREGKGRRLQWRSHGTHQITRLNKTQQPYVKTQRITSKENTELNRN